MYLRGPTLRGCKRDCKPTGLFCSSREEKRIRKGDVFSTRKTVKLTDGVELEQTLQRGILFLTQSQAQAAYTLQQARPRFL